MSHELNEAAAKVWGLLLSDRGDEIEEDHLREIQRVEREVTVARIKAAIREAYPREIGEVLVPILDEAGR